MATHSSVLAWRIPGTEEPSGLLSMGSHRVGHDWSDLAAAAAGTTPSSLLILIHSVFIIVLWHRYIIILVLFTLFLIGGWLLYNMVSASAIQHESAISTHICLLSWTSAACPTPSQPSRLSQSTRLNSLLPMQQLPICYLVKFYTW